MHLATQEQAVDLDVTYPRRALNTIAGWRTADEPDLDSLNG
jgi:hypothetical protein